MASTTSPTRPDLTYGPRKALVTFSTLDNTTWELEHTWIDAKTTVSRDESSRLTSREELDAYAGQLGLTRIGHFTNLSSEAADDISATTTCVYQKPPTQHEHHA